MAILWNPSGADQFKAAESATRSLGIRIQSLEIRNPRGLAKAFATAAKEHADAVFVVTTAVFFRERLQLSKLADGVACAVELAGQDRPQAPLPVAMKQREEILRCL